MTELEMAGRALIECEPVPLTPIDQIRARASAVAARRRARRRRMVALAVVTAALVGAAAWARSRPTTTREPVAVVPAPTTAAPTPTSRSIAPSTNAVSTGTVVTAARITSATLGMAATIPRPGDSQARLWLSHGTGAWQEVTPAGGILGDVEDVLALDPHHLYATSFNCAMAAVTAWRSVDGGRTWSHSPAGYHSCAVGSSGLQFVDPLHGWIILRSPAAPFASLEGTTDGGATWHEVDHRLPAIGDLSFVTPAYGYLGVHLSLPDSRALYVTDDAGRTWHAVALPFDDRSLPNPSWSVTYGVPTFVDDRDGVLPVTLAKANTADLEWWTTNDRGSTWQLRTPPSVGLGGINDMPPEPAALPTSVTGPHVWWVFSRTSTGSQSWVTVDGGIHWTDREDTALPWPDPTWFGAANARVAWMLGRGRLYATADAGLTWMQIAPPT